MTREQIQQLAQAINDRYGFIAAQLQSVNYQPDPAQLERWKRLGLVPESVTPETFMASIPPEMHLLRNAFILGRVAKAVERGATYAEAMRLATTMPLLLPDEAAIAIAEQQTAMFITNNAADLATAIGQEWAKHQAETVRAMAVEYHRQNLRAIIRDEDEKRIAGEEIPERQVDTWQGFASELHHTLDDKTRDWQRVAYYEITDAQKQGQAHTLMAQEPDQLVYKMPLPTACPQCKYAYLLQDGKTPRIFRLSELVANGTNIGRKPHPVKGGKVAPGGRADGAEELKPVAGLMHPWCACLGPHPVTGYEPWLTPKQKKIVEQTRKI